MSKPFSLRELEPLIRETLDRGGTFCLKPRGVSMLPLIREGKDEVFLSPLPERVGPGDVVFYKRDNGNYVLHRVIFEKNGEYTLCGDHQRIFETGIRRGHLIALVSGIKKPDGVVDFAADAWYAGYRETLLKEKQNLYRTRHIRTVVGKLKAGAKKILKK